MIRSLAAAARIALLSTSGLAAAAVLQPQHAAPCIDGFAEGYRCSNVDLAAHISLAALGAEAGEDGNDIWGWTDPVNGDEYALVGVGNGVAFVDVTVPDHPQLVGFLPKHTGTDNSLWRDVKVYADHAFVVSEAVGHGMQVFDLTRLRNVAARPATFTEDAHYNRFGKAHNIVINQDTGFAYAVGSRGGTVTCDGGLHMIDISTPTSPVEAGCFSADGYTHDAQCVIYSGPDADHQGRELCFNANEDTLTIVDVTDKQAPQQIARVGYSGSRYAHQGWLTGDQRWYLMNDELDESNFGHNTRTYVWDLQDLDNPQQTFAYTGPLRSIDHNLYIRDQYAFLANYTSGLRILDLSAIEQGSIVEVAYFDTYPADDLANEVRFDGAWSSYPFFDSGTVVVSDISRGLFVLQPDLCEEPAAVDGLTATGSGDNSIGLEWTGSTAPDVSYQVFRELDGCGGGPGELLAEGLSAPGYDDLLASGSVNYGYRVRAVVDGGQCRSGFSACVAASTSGTCTAPPRFDGLASAESVGADRCAVDLAWSAATPRCNGPARFNVYRSTDSGFVPSAASLISTDLQATNLRDFDVNASQAYHYIVRASDLGNASEDANLVRRDATPLGPVSVGSWRNGAEAGEPFLGSGAVIPLSATGPTPRHVAWHFTDETFDTGERSYVSGYSNGECIALTTPAIDIGSNAHAQLEFAQRYGIEEDWDGGRVEISTNGEDWQPLDPIGGYPGQITGAGNACGWPLGSGVYNGTSLAWAIDRVDLSAYDGEIHLRWVFSTDSAVSAQGWWIDSITVAPAQVAGSCTTIPASHLFGDGFEDL